MGHIPVGAFTGKEAIEQAESTHPDLILLSLLFPDVDGVAVLRKLHGQAKTTEIPVIVLTTAASAETIETRLSGLGVAGILRKPVIEQELRTLTTRIFNDADATKAQRHVLVIDDGTLPRRLLEVSLETAGCHALCLDRVGLARSLFESLRPEAVIVASHGDLIGALPLIESFAVNGQLPIPVLAVAGVLRPDTFHRLTRLGVREILLTPVAPRRLWRALARLLPGPPGTERDGSREKSVLLVEDAALVAKMLASLLEEEGCQVTQARSAEDALTIIRREKPELMLLDLILPGIDGVKFVRQLEASDLRVPFAVVTAGSNPDQMCILRDLGMMKLFEKPIHSEDLLAFVHDFFTHESSPMPAD